MNKSHNMKKHDNTKIQSNCINKISVESRLPVRSKSKLLGENRKASQSNTKEKEPKKIKSISTWSDLTTESDKNQTLSSTLSKYHKESRWTSKIQIKSRQPQIRKILSTKSLKVQTKSIKKFQLPVHRNNSSCGKLITIDDKPVIGSIETKNDSGVDMKSTRNNGQKNKSSKEKSNNSKSMFRLFKIKINLFREQHHIQNIGESKSSNDLSIKVPSENSVSKVHEYKILGQPFTKQFLFNLYNECRKLNKNISKLSNETSDFNKRFKNLMLAENLFGKYQNFFYNSNKKLDKFSKSFASCNKSKSFSTELDKNDFASKYYRSKSEFRSVKLNQKNLPENDGHYYHLACLLSTDPDPINSTVNNTRGDNKTTLSRIKSKSVKDLRDDVTNDITSKENSYESVKTSIKVGNDAINKENKDNFPENNIHEFDDTLCDLNEDMKTDSLDEIKINKKDIKSPGSPSTYLTANENLTMIKSKQQEKTCQSKLEPNMTSSSFEMPPSLSNKDIVNKMSSQMSFPDMEPPESFKPSSSDQEPLPIVPSSQTPVSQYVAIFEKQFPQNMVLLNPMDRQLGLNVSLTNQTLPKFTSSITVNCHKDDKSSSHTGSQNLENTRLFFNPFKPPKCSTSKFLQFLNCNNNNNNISTDIVENENSRIGINSSEGRTRSESTGNVENKNNDESQEVVVLEEPLKRVAPLKQLLMHSRNSDKMNSVFNENEGRISPSNNSYIEKQRQKKLIKQQEQHQKAKDMAVEAARLRKERQSEIQSLDSFDSSRIVERLFTENKDIDYPEFSLYDACHFNFTKRKPRVPKPLAQSTIKGILPVEPEAPPEPPKSPITYEKFRNKPIELIKHVHVKKEISKKELEKYEPINLLKPLTDLKDSAKSPIEIKNTIEESKKIDQNDKTSGSHQIEFASSNSEGSSSNSISSFSASSPSSSESDSIESSQSISLPSIKQKHKTRRHSKSNDKKKESSANKKLESLKPIKPDDKERTQIIITNDKTLDLPEVLELKETNLNSKMKEVKSEEKSKIDIEVFETETVKVNNKKEKLQLADIKFDDIFKRHDEVVIKCDVNVSTEDSTMKTGEVQCNEADIISQTIDEFQNFPPNVGCHLNYQNKYNENLLDRKLTVNINIPIPDTSLSGFVQELNSQLYSLADTVDIVMDRMEVFEANLMDATKYFVLK